MILVAQANFDDKNKNKLNVSIDLQGHNEFEHEILGQFFGAPRSVSLSPNFHEQVMKVEFSVEDAGAFNKAVRALENRRRKVDGKPSLEEEEAAAKQTVQEKAAAK